MFPQNPLISENRLIEGLTQDLFDQHIRDVLSRITDGLPWIKVARVISHPQYVKGIWNILKRHKIPFSKHNHSVVVDFISNIITQGSNLEPEWSEEQFTHFVSYSE